MRRRYVFIDGGAPSGGGGGGTLQQTVQLDLGDVTWNTPVVAGWFRFCSDNSSPITNILNSTGSNTGWSLSRSGAINGFSEGPTTSTTAGYPSDVTKYGNVQTTSITYTFNNLNNAYTYTFDFFASTLRTWESSSGTSIWTIGGTSVSILHMDYYGDKVTISSKSPSSGSIVIDVSKNASATNWYWNACVIKEYN